jgi:Ser/Thr protein kinase RdoA (MazF antagonist)
MAFASRDLPVPEVVEIGDAFGGAYAVSARHYGSNLEDVRPDQCDVAGPMLASLLGALYRVPKSPDLPVGWHWRPTRGDLTWRSWLSERLVDDPNPEVRDWRAALAAQSEADRIFRACEARVRDLAESCPERRDLVHGDLLLANVLVAEDASRPSAVFSWKCSVRGDFLFDVAGCTFWSPWYPGSRLLTHGATSDRSRRSETTPTLGSAPPYGTIATSGTSEPRTLAGTPRSAISRR